MANLDVGTIRQGITDKYREAAVEALPFPDADFDVAISNGVLNLVPDKPAAGDSSAQA